MSTENVQAIPAPVPELSQESFRQQLAGLFEPSEPANYSEFRPVAVRIAAFLARHYNRDALDPKALWSRIETAILSGVEKRTDDPASMVSEMLSHVKADAGRVARDEDFAAIISELEEKDSSWVEGLCSYMRKAVYVVLTFARVAWQNEKREKSARPTAEDEAAARESGEKPSPLFSEDEVREAAAKREAARAESEVGND